MSEQDPAAGRTAAPTPGPRAARARELVVAALEGCDGALGAWEAGSAAFGRADIDSDLDVGVLCAPGRATAMLDAVEESLRGSGDDPVRWDVGRSAFGVQRFWRPAREERASTCMVDVSVMELEGERDLWRELLLPERHGRALELCDVDGALQDARSEATFDADAHRERIAEQLRHLAERRAMFHDFAAKELARARPLDAHGMHQLTAAVPLVTLLGIRYRPLRFDFARYLHDELPPHVVERLAPIARPGHADDVLAANAAGLEWIDELLAELDAAELPIEAHAASMRASFG